MDSSSYFSQDGETRQQRGSRILRTIDWLEVPTANFDKYSLAEIDELSQVLQRDAERIMFVINDTSLEYPDRRRILEQWYNDLCIWRLEVYRVQIHLRNRERCSRSARFLPGRKKFLKQPPSKGKN